MMKAMQKKELLIIKRIVQDIKKRCDLLHQASKDPQVVNNTLKMRSIEGEMQGLFWALKTIYKRAQAGMKK